MSAGNEVRVCVFISGKLKNVLPPKKKPHNVKCWILLNDWFTFMKQILYILEEGGLFFSRRMLLRSVFAVMLAQLVDIFYAHGKW